MPCNCDHMNATNKEIELSKIACLLDELTGQEINTHHWGGYHPYVYSNWVDGDALIAELCNKIQRIDVTQYSLEMQTWWRDHKKIDKARIESELKQQKTAHDKEQALVKLTDYERELLDL